MGIEIPHFLFLNDYKYGKDFDEAFETVVNDACMNAWPGFENIQRQQIQPEPDLDNPGCYLNAKAYLLHQL